MLVGILGHPVVGEELPEGLVPGGRPGPYAARQFDEGRGAAAAQQIRLAVEVGARGVDDVGLVRHVNSCSLDRSAVEVPGTSGHR